MGRWGGETYLRNGVNLIVIVNRIAGLLLINMYNMIQYSPPLMKVMNVVVFKSLVASLGYSLFIQAIDHDYQQRNVLKNVLAKRKQSWFQSYVDPKQNMKRKLDIKYWNNIIISFRENPKFIKRYFYRSNSKYHLSLFQYAVSNGYLRIFWQKGTPKIKYCGNKWEDWKTDLYE